MNKVILMGRLTRDPEVRYSQGATEPLCITKYALAVDRRFRREGEQTVDFINCTVFGKAGEFAEKYFRKGMMVAVTGRLQIRNYDDPQTNQKRTFTDVVVDEQYFAESKASFESRVGNQAAKPQPASAPPSQEADAPPDFFIDQELSDDDLPF